MNIIILSAAYNSDATQSIIKAGEKRGHKMIVKNPAYLYLLVSESVNGYDAIYDGYNTDTPQRLAAKDIDAIIPRIGANLSYGASVLEHMNRNLKIFATQTAEGIKCAADKLISTQRLSQAHIRVPQTVLGDKANHPKWIIEKAGGLPAIAKELTGSQGRQVYPLNDEYQTNVFLSNFGHKEENLLIQSFIDAGGRDIRAIVINGRVVVAMERTAQKGELRANISQGGSGRKIELSEEDQTMCVNAARACGLECAGVDIMKDKNGVSYCIEVNGNFGFKVMNITGVDIATPLIEYCEQNYKQGNKANLEPSNQIFTQPVEEHNDYPDDNDNSFWAFARRLEEVKNILK